MLECFESMMQAWGTDPVYIGNNWSEEMFPYAEESFEWLELFDGVVVSGRVKMIKPDRDIFDHLFETYGLRAEDVIFIDDHEPNIVAARDLGIHAHHFRDAIPLRGELVARGLLA